LLRNWVAGLPDPPVFTGAIGMSVGGIMTPRLAVLFREKLLAWDRPLDAVHEKRPQFCMGMDELRSFAKTGNKGIVMYFNTKTIAFHALVERDQDQWARMLMSILDPQKANGMYRPIVEFTEIYTEKDAMASTDKTARRSKKMTALASARLSMSEPRRSVTPARTPTSPSSPTSAASPKFKNAQTPTKIQLFPEEAS